MICLPCDKEPELVFGFEDVVCKVNQNYTVSFTSMDDSWVSFHDYNPRGIWATRDEAIYSIFQDLLYKHNQDNVGKYYEGVTHPSYITPVFTSEYMLKEGIIAMQLVNVSWNTNADRMLKGCNDYNDIERQQITFTSASVHTSYQSTGDIKLIPFDSSKTVQENYGVANIRKVTNRWHFNKFRDMIVNRNSETFMEFLDDCVVINSNTSVQNYLRRFHDDYIILKLDFDNVLQIDLRIQSVDITNKPILR
jgi:hypothetical protein